MSTILNKEKILEEARALVDEGKYDKAIREYEKILTVDQSDMRVKLRIAELYTKRKQITEAIRFYREVAESYAADGFFLKAVTVYKNILRLNPSLSEINEQLAILYEKMGLVSDAIRQYDIIAAALDTKGRADRAIEARARIVKLNPKDGAARVRLAELYQREGKEDEALNQYEEYARQLEGSSGSKTKLAEIYEKILAHRPDREEMLFNLIHIYEEQSDHKKALKWLEVGRGIIEKNAEMLGLMARIYASQHQNDTARQVYQKLAELHLANGDGEAAIGAYCEILILLPDEEDRLTRKIEELKPGAAKDVVRRAHLARKRIEEDELSRQVAEDAAKEASRSGGGKGRRNEEETWPPEKKISKSAPAPHLSPARASENSMKEDADSAYNLGMIYHQSGLDDEAKPELEKALSIYKNLAAAGSSDEEILERVKEIEKLVL